MINVIGLGYIGLPTALMFAANGNEVHGTDLNQEVVDVLRRGVVPFEETGIEELFSRALEGNIAFSTEYIRTHTYIIAVPTPYDSITKKIDVSYVISAVERVLDVCEDGATIVIESTISPGTVDRSIRPTLARAAEKTGMRVHVAHAPERIIPGNMIYELVHNNRTVGVDDKAVGHRLSELYSSFSKGNITITDICTAEMSKVVENTFRDVNIAFANELARICASGGIDVHEVIRIANMHPRVNILSPGPGVGGHCIPVDPWFLVGDYPDLTKLILASREVNDDMPRFILERTLEILDSTGRGKLRSESTVGFYGITYKENVDDIRESPTLQLLTVLETQESLGSVRFYDPWVTADVIPNQMHSFEEFMDGLDLLVIMVGHDHIKDRVSGLSDVTIFDTRNIAPMTPSTFRI